MILFADDSHKVSLLQSRYGICCKRRGSMIAEAVAVDYLEIIEKLPKI